MELDIRFDGGYKSATGTLIGNKIGIHTSTLSGIDPSLSIAGGLVPGVTLVNKFGLNPDIDTGSVPEDVWGGGGPYTGFPDIAPEILRFTSTSASDSAAGTGARTVQVTGLDANWNILSETITLNGLTPVTSVNTFRRVHTMRTITAGSGGVNAGDITVQYNTTTSVVFLVMATGRNQTNNVSFTIPEGYTGYVTKVHGVIRLPGTATDNASGNLWIREFGEVFRSRRPFIIRTEAPWNDEIYGGLRLPSKSDITVRITNVAASNTEVIVALDIVLIQNNLYNV